MALQDIGFGSKAESSIINSNFHYLNDLITSLNTTVSGLQSSFNAQIENTRKSLQKNIDTATTKANNAQTTANKALYNTNKNTAYITTVSGNSNAGCIVYSNKYCEQWGITNTIIGDDSDDRKVTVTFSKEFKDTNYSVQTGMLFVSGSGEANDDSCWVLTRNAKNMQLFASHQGHDSEPRVKIMWKATGFLK